MARRFNMSRLLESIDWDASTIKVTLHTGPLPPEEDCVVARRWDATTVTWTATSGGWLIWPPDDEDVP